MSEQENKECCQNNSDCCAKTEVAETGCCPKFNPEPWKNKAITWNEKMFIKDSIFCLFRIPLNTDKVIKRMDKKITEAGAKVEGEDFIMLFDDPTPWKSNVYIAVSKEVANAENVKLSGSYLTKVFEGPYSQAGKWYKEMSELAKNAGQEPKKIYFYYTTCPKCAKAYGKNYVVGLVQI